MFIMTNITRMPSNSLPSSQPVAPPSSPKLIVQVGEALMPILCSTDTTFRSLGSPSVPSSFTMILGTTKQEMPLVPGGASGVRASTRWMTFSAMS
jgi:hypothetical protein